MPDLTRSEAHKLLGRLSERRDRAIEAGDLELVRRIEAKAAEIEAALADAPRQQERSGQGEKKSGCGTGCAVVLAVVLGLAMLGSLVDGSDSPTTRTVSATSTTVDEDEGVPLSDQVGAALETLDGFDPADFTGSEASLVVGVGMFLAFADLVERAEAADEPEAARLRQSLAAVQRRAFPRFRDAYGPIARAKVWEDDMDVRTVGGGYRTIQFTGALFAANRNIAEFQRGVIETLQTLRFKRAEYRWYRDASQYQYYDFESPDDGEVIGT